VSSQELDQVKELIRAIGFTPDEAVAQAVDILSKEDKIKMFSEVEMREVERLSLLFTIAERYNLGWLRTYVMNELMLRVSHKRLGRREFVQMIAAKLRKPVKSLIKRVREKATGGEEL
jgi:hypothetical protein